MERTICQRAGLGLGGPRLRGTGPPEGGTTSGFRTPPTIRCGVIVMFRQRRNPAVIDRRYNSRWLNRLVKSGELASGYNSKSMSVTAPSEALVTWAAYLARTPRV